MKYNEDFIKANNVNIYFYNNKNDYFLTVK